ncbi:hypothetical protein C0995_012149 [Termitomyces sp. Mi166|nr:hypothetical protein C0995_012149 [Termitomyces sp. Mi166\
MLLAQAKYVQYTHPVDEALLQCLERAEQPVPAMAAFLQDDLAIMVVEGLLDQIEFMRRQRVSMLEQIEHIGKHKAPTFKELMMEPKWARAPSQRPQKLVWVPVHTVAWLLLQPLKLASRVSTSRSIRMDPVPMHQVQEPDILAEPLAELLLEASNQIMSDALAVQQEQRSKAPQAPVASSSKAGASSQRGARVLAAVESHRLSVFVPALNVPGPSKHCRGQKPQADMSKMDVVNFSSNVPTQVGLGQMLFLHAVAILAPPPQLAVIVVTTDPRTPEQYDGLVAIQQKAVAASKGKEKIVPTLSDESDYSESLSEHEQESEEGESAA